MKKYTIPLTLLLFSCLSANETGNTSHQMPEPAPTECGERPRPIRLAIRHIEANGIGYSEGYTTIEGFLTPIYPNKWLCLKDQWLPFADVRLHIFNDGEPAVNAGLGIRYLASHMVWGANAYYDFRKTSHQNYNQVALGFEGLGRIWDWRINGYLPVGDTSWYSKVKFEGFEGNSLIISQKHQFALKGFNAEAGIHISEFKNKRIGNMFSKTPFYVAAGPYYLAGHGKSSWGAEARFTLDLYEYVRLEGNTSYDNIFHGIGQGQLTVQIPLGRKKKVYARKGESCGRALAMSERAVQRVDRNEIIPIKKEHVKSPAIDPATGEPYYFLFVDNTSHSAGTYESPYPTLLMAQNASSPNDVIYVFPGDGTDTGMDAGITLKDNQYLLGSSTPHPLNTTIGGITVPAMTTGLPLLTFPGISTSIGNVVTLANNNEISGFVIHGMGSINGIGGGIGAGLQEITDLRVGDSTIISDAANGIYLAINSKLGTVVVSNCSFLSNSGIAAIEVYENNYIDTITMSNCSTSGSDYGLLIVYSGYQNNVNIVNCPNITGGINGVYFPNNASHTGIVTIENSNITGILNEAISFYGNNIINSINIIGCNLSGGRNGLDIVDNNTVTNVYISNVSLSVGKMMSGNGIDFVGFELLGPATIGNCQITNSSDGLGINFDSMDALSPVLISNCTLNVNAGSTGVSFTNTPYYITSFAPPPFRVNLLNNTVVNSPPVTGYYIDNTGPQSGFTVETYNNIGTTDFINVTRVQ